MISFRPQPFNTGTQSVMCCTEYCSETDPTLSHTGMFPALRTRHTMLSLPLLAISATLHAPFPCNESEGLLVPSAALVSVSVFWSYQWERYL